MNMQTLPWLKFSHESYLFGFRIGAKAAVKAAYLDLLCLCMKQTPALSIPNDDSLLANWLGMTVKAWQKIKPQVMTEFSLNADNNRYYSNMLVNAYNNEDQPTQEAKDAKTAMTNAERQAAYRARIKAEQEALQRNEAVTDSVTQRNAPSNNEVTDSNADFVTFGGIKGGDLDLNLDKNINKNQSVVVNTDSVNNSSATTATKVLMSFYFEPDQDNVTKLIKKLEVDPSKNTAANLNNFIAYYLNKGFLNTQADWDYQYVKWLARQHDQKQQSIPSTQEPKKAATGDMIYGVLKSDIERMARAGESYEQAAYRIKQQRAQQQEAAWWH